MKQNYITPETILIEVEPAEMLAVSSIQYTSQTASNNHEALGNNHRGTWGNLWE